MCLNKEISRRVYCLVSALSIVLPYRCLSSVSLTHLRSLLSSSANPPLLPAT